MLKGFLGQLKKVNPKNHKIKRVIIPRSEHGLSRSAIHRNALKVLYRLHGAGFQAYLVGGCVRDLLLGIKPKDFDVATDAKPEEVHKLFRNCILIGKRFRLAHILFGKDIVEVATFRTHHDNAHELQGKSLKGMIIRDNVYGNIEDDAFRRDFRMNALYYNIADFSVVDFVGGIDDIHSRVLHMIGDPDVRFQEDPVRLLRAIRFMAKLDFSITPETETPLRRLSHLLQQVSSGRLFQEVLKIFQSGKALKTIQLLEQYNLLKELFPCTEGQFEKAEVTLLIHTALDHTDQRQQEEKSISPAFLFAVFLWYPICNECKKLGEERLPIFVALDKALQTVLKKQTQRLAIPRVLQVSVREITLLQHRLTLRRGTQPYRLLNHPRFRAAYDLLLLRAKAEPNLTELANWWIDFHQAAPEQREQLLKTTEQTAGPRRKKYKKRKKREDNT